ncbi:hypothetical protein [Bosea caraganae]|nr:hypothetical protein [Bosea caraganae]
MSHAHSHPTHRPATDNPGWSLLRLSAASRLGIAVAIIAALWAATLAVIA